MSYLILVRHGESRWNQENLFTGWVDVPLSKKGINEALQCAKKLEDLSIDIAFTSSLTRAQETLLLILGHQRRTGIFIHQSKKKLWNTPKHQYSPNEIPVHTSDLLNERHYGTLQGKNKQAARKAFGEQQVFTWRRSWDIRPPQGESLKDTYNRAVPYFAKTVMPHIRKGKNVIITAHGNSLRAIIKYIENIDNDKIPLLELPTGKPIVYTWYGKHFDSSLAHTFDRPAKW